MTFYRVNSTTDREIRKVMKHVVTLNGRLSHQPKKFLIQLYTFFSPPGIYYSRKERIGFTYTK